MALFLLDPVEDLLRADPRAGAGGLWHCLWSRLRPTVGQSHPSGVLVVLALQPCEYRGSVLHVVCNDHADGWDHRGEL